MNELVQTENPNDYEIIVVPKQRRSRSGKIKLSTMEYDPTDPVCLYLVELSARSQFTIYRCLRQFAVWYLQHEAALPEHIMWQDLDRNTVIDFLLYLEYKHKNKDNSLEVQLATTTRNLYLTSLKRVCTLSATRKGIHPRKKLDAENLNEITSIKPVKGSRVPTGRELTRKEEELFFDACDQHKNKDLGLRNKAIFILMIDAGLRIHEVAGMKFPENYNIEKGFIKIIGKGNKERQIKLTGRARAITNNYINKVRNYDSGDLWQVFNKGGRVQSNNNITDIGIRKMLKVFSIKAGTEPFKSHDLRRTFATRLIRLGVDIFTVQKLLGHSSPSVTQKYDRREDDACNEAIDVLSEVA